MKPIKLLTPSNPNGRILAIGELLIDFIPAEMGTSLSQGGALIKTASGSSGIFACAVAGLSDSLEEKRESAGFIGKLGQDSLSVFVQNVMKSQGVDMSSCVISSEGQVGLAFIEYSEKGRNYEYYRGNSVGSHLDKSDLNSEYIEKAFALHYSGMLLELSESMRSACLTAAEIAKKAGVLVSFDPNIRKELLKDDGAKQRLKNAISNADIITPTLDEAKFITGKEKISEIISELHNMGPKLVAVTCDKNGAVLSCGGEAIWAHGIDFPVVDPTGAGDTFAATLAYSLRQGFTLEQAAVFCNCAGTFVVGRRGAVGMALPTLLDITDMVNSDICKISPLNDDNFIY